MRSTAERLGHGILAILVVALCVPAHADRGRGRAGRERERVDAAAGERAERAPSTRAERAERAPEETQAVPIAPIAPPRAAADVDIVDAVLRSAFETPPARAGSLAVVARRPGGVLIGDRAIALAEAWERGGTWSTASLATGSSATFPAPMRIVPSGRVGVLAANAWAAGDVLVAHDGERALLVRADGSVVHGETRGHASLLGAASVGAQVIVWWRLDATHTELEALDGASARSLWRRAGPAWAWDTRMVAGGGRVALLAAGEITVIDAAGGTPIGRFALGALLSGVGWPHPLALGGGALVVAAPGGVVVIDPSSGAQRALATGAGALPSLVAADERTAFVAQGQDLVALDLATGATRWAVRVAHLRSVDLASSHLVVCDVDGGAIVIERATGAAALRVGVGGCDVARALEGGTIAIAGSRETWIVGAAAAGTTTRPAQLVEGVVTLDGAPTAGLPVLLGAGSHPLDGADGCPPLPPYARCVLTDDEGRFRARVRALGLLPVVVHRGVAARRAGRPRAVGGATVIDLDTTALHPLRLDVVGADPEL